MSLHLGCFASVFPQDLLQPEESKCGNLTNALWCAFHKRDDADFKSVSPFKEMSWPYIKS